MFKNFQVVELISSKTKAQLSIYRNKLKFSIATAVDIDGPEYVQLIIDTKTHAFGVRACNKDDDNAIPFYTAAKRGKPWPIIVNHKAPCDMIANMMGWNDDSKYYVVMGQKFADERAIIFNLNDADEHGVTSRKSDGENKSDDE